MWVWVGRGVSGGVLVRWQQQRQHWRLMCADCRIRGCKVPSARANEQQWQVHVTSSILLPCCCHHCALAAVDGAPIEGCSQGRAVPVGGEWAVPKAQLRAWHIAKLQPAQH